MLIETQFPIQVLQLSPMKPTKQTQQTDTESELDIITSDTFDISTQEFESAFVFNAFSPSTGSDFEGVKANIYDPAASPSSPRSSWSLESSSSSRDFSRASSVDMMSPTSGRFVTSFSRHSPASSVSSVNSDFRSVAKHLAPSNGDLTVPILPSALSRSLAARSTRRHTLGTASNPSSDTLSTVEDTISQAPPIFSSPRYFSTTNAALPLEPRPKRRSIVNSPWTCLEDAHHPLCTGSCDQGVFSSSYSPPESMQVSRSGSVSSTKWSTPTWKQCPPVPPKDPRRRSSLIPESLRR